MRRVALTLAALGVVGLAASLAVAADRPHASAPSAAVTLVSDHGQHGPSRGYPGFRYGTPYHHDFGPRGFAPPARRPPAVILPYYWSYPPVMYPPVLYPPVYEPYPYYYRPRAGFHYFGDGFGISIGF